jgi:hypothetical protein
MAKSKSTAKKAAPAKTASKARVAGKQQDSGNLQSIVGSIGTLLTTATSGRLNEVLLELKDRVSSIVVDDGPKILKDAKKKLVKAADDLLEWGKEHPVKTAAAAASLIAVSTFLYSTMKSQESAAAKR